MKTIFQKSFFQSIKLNTTLKRMELEQIFTEKFDLESAVNLLRRDRHDNYKNGMALKWAEKLTSIFPSSLQILDEYALFLYYHHKQEKSFDIYAEVLKKFSISKDNSTRIVMNQSFSIPIIEGRYDYYNEKLVNQITNRPKDDVSCVSLSITSCKRLDLFKRTVNSFINSCTDLNLISEWFCVDDNSSLDDREEMKRLYPFFTFYFKSIEEKGVK